MLSQRTASQLDKNFNTIYRILRNKDKEGLAEIIESGIDINIIRGDFSPIGLLARRGKREAVEFAIKELENRGEDVTSTRKEAVFGAAIGGNSDLIMYLLLQENDPHKLHELYSTALIGFIASGNHKANLSNLIYHGLMTPQMRNDFFREDKNKETALHEAASALTMVRLSKEKIYFRQAQNWLIKNKYRDGDYLTGVKMLKLIDIINNGTIGLPIKRFTNNPFPYALDFELAQVWLVPDIHIWFLMGREKFRENNFPLEIFIKISSYVFNIIDEDTCTLLNRHIHTVPKILYDLSIKAAEEKLTRSGDVPEQIFPTLFESAPKVLQEMSVKARTDNNNEFGTFVEKSLLSISSSFFSVSPEKQKARLVLEEEKRLAEEKYSRRSKI